MTLEDILTRMNEKPYLGPHVMYDGNRYHLRCITANEPYQVEVSWEKGGDGKNQLRNFVLNEGLINPSEKLDFMSPEYVERYCKAKDGNLHGFSSYMRRDGDFIVEIYLKRQGKNEKCYREKGSYEYVKRELDKIVYQDIEIENHPML